MQIGELQKNWEAFAQTDPMWAILSVPDKQGGKWNPDEFFRSGAIEIEAVLSRGDALGITIKRGKALDFGCGIGRLTQALCQHFETCYGVDIAPTMISEARRFNRFGDRCNYVVNSDPDLRLFPDGVFSFIYTNIVLQHMQPRYSKGYIREFLRVLAPGGIALFQVPSHLSPHTTTGGLQKSVAEAPLPAAAFQAEFGSPGREFHVAAGERFAVSIAIRNAGPVAWPALGLADGNFQLFLGNHWLKSDGSPVAYDDGRCPLPHDIAPQTSIALTLNATAPASPGGYLVELDMAQQGVGWFKERGSQTLRIPIDVRPGAVTSVPAKLPVRERFPELYRLLQTLNLLPLARRLRDVYRQTKIKRSQSAQPVSAPVMEMYGLPRREVEQIVRENGGEMLQVDDDKCAGIEWVSYRYWVRRT